MAPKLRPWSVALWLLAWQGGSMALAAAYPGQNQSLTQVLSTADARLVRLSEEQP